MIEQVKSLRIRFKKTLNEVELEAHFDDLLLIIAGQEDDNEEEETDA